MVLLNSAAALATENGDFATALWQPRPLARIGRGAGKAGCADQPQPEADAAIECNNGGSVMTILDEIFAHKREEVAAAQARRARSAECAGKPKRERPAAGFCRRPARGRQEAMLRSSFPALIAEVKRASPSRGLLVTDFDPLRLARIYQENGAAAISVLTDERYFQGHLDYLRQIAALDIAGLPLLRKDFICDPYQVYEARAAGADAVLLIAAYLEPGSSARSACSDPCELGMAALVEVHRRAELEAVLALRPGAGGDQQPRPARFYRPPGDDPGAAPACPAGRLPGGGKRHPHAARMCPPGAGRGRCHSGGRGAGDRPGCGRESHANLAWLSEK